MVVTEGRGTIHEKHLHYVFCSERHAMYYVNGHQDLGNLPAGQRQLILPR